MCSEEKANKAPNTGLLFANLNFLINKFSTGKYKLFHCTALV